MKFENSTRKIFKSNEYLKKKKTHVHVARQVSMIWAGLVFFCLSGINREPLSYCKLRSLFVVHWVKAKSYRSR